MDGAEEEQRGKGMRELMLEDGGPAETVADGETGFLVEPGDSAALAREVIMLLRAGVGLALYSPKTCSGSQSRKVRMVVSFNCG